MVPRFPMLERREFSMLQASCGKNGVQRPSFTLTSISAARNVQTLGTLASVTHKKVLPQRAALAG
jgi:hypothetical protein